MFANNRVVWEEKFNLITAFTLERQKGIYLIYHDFNSIQRQSLRMKDPLSQQMLTFSNNANQQ